MRLARASPRTGDRHEDREHHRSSHAVRRLRIASGHVWLRRIRILRRRVNRNGRVERGVVLEFRRRVIFVGRRVRGSGPVLRRHARVYRLAVAVLPASIRWSVQRNRGVRRNLLLRWPTGHALEFSVSQRSDYTVHRPESKKHRDLWTVRASKRLMLVYGLWHITVPVVL
jgi:hypothetical protein